MPKGHHPSGRAPGRERTRCRAHRGRPGAPHGRPRPRRALPQTAGRARGGGPERAGADPRGRLHRCLLRRARRGDRGAGRPGRRRSQRGRPRGLRRRPLGRGRGPGRRRRADPRGAQQGHRRRRGPGARGPSGPGPGHGDVHRPQHRPHRPEGDHDRRTDEPGRRTRPRPGLGGQAAGQVRPARRHRRHAVRRQPAEGCAGQVARHRPARADRRRAHPRDRRGHQGGGAPAAVPPGRPGSPLC